MLSICLASGRTSNVYVVTFRGICRYNGCAFFTFYFVVPLQALAAIGIEAPYNKPRDLPILLICTWP